MANNKFADVTRKRILDTTYRLFMERGWAETTIQDIIDEIGDLTRGAFYHHFRSKDDIIDAITTRMYAENNPFDVVSGENDLNGLEKLKKVFTLLSYDENFINIVSQAAYKNPSLFYRLIEDSMSVTAPSIERLIREGITDGSIQTEYPKQAAETVSTWISIYLAPKLTRISRKEYMDRLEHADRILSGIGLNLMDQKIKQLYLDIFDNVNQ